MVIDNVRKLIEELGISAEEAAEAAGMQVSAMEQALAGEASMSLEECASLCSRYGVPITEVMSAD